MLYCGNDDEKALSNEIAKKVKLTDDSSGTAKPGLSQILCEHSCVFSETPGTIKGFVYRFKVWEHRKFFVRPYPILWVYKEQVEEETKRMLAEGVIE